MEKNNTRPLGSESLGILLKKLRSAEMAETFADWRWAAGFARPFRGRVAAYTAAGIAANLCALASGVAGKYIIDIVSRAGGGRILPHAVVLVLGAALSIFFGAASSRLSAKLNIDMNNAIQAELFSSLLEKDYLSLSRLESGDVLSRFTSDVGAIASNAVGWLPKLVQAGASFIAALAVILYYDRVMAVIALLSAPVLALASRPLMGGMKRLSGRMKELGSRLMQFEVESFHSLDMIKSFASEETSCADLRKNQESYGRASLDYNLLSIRARVLMSAAGRAVEYAALAYCLWRLWSGSISFGTVTLFLQQRASLSAAFSSLTALLPAAVACSVSARRVRELMALPREERGPGGAREPETGVSYGVGMSNAGFSYEKGRPVVSGAEFMAMPGEVTAIVGPSGEGKTSLLRLMLGLVSPDEGRCFIFGGGEEIPVSANTRRFFAYVPQGGSMLPESIADNLRLTKPDASEAELVSALKAACAWEFVERLPQGLNTRLGERGCGLSEGQSQRLAIARALLREAPVLLLDEASSALDPDTERRVLESILAHRPDRTVVLTTHRAAILSSCSRVYRMSGGNLRELERPYSI